MRFWKSWIVAAKDLSVFRNNKYILYSLIAMPLLMGLLIPVFLLYTLQAQAAVLTQAQLIELASNFVNLFSSFFVVTAIGLPTIIASYSFIGEKLEKSLEPLLATPTTDGELLFGKSLGAFIPCIGRNLHWRADIRNRHRWLVNNQLGHVALADGVLGLGDGHHYSSCGCSQR